MTGLVFGAMGVSCAVTGTLVPRAVSRLGAPRVLATGLLLQAVLTAAMLTIGQGAAGTWTFLVLGAVAGSRTWPPWSPPTSPRRPASRTTNRARPPAW
ncbi:hypothetical protein [Streptacidiphilus monticola]|uniref:Major facilitator superfamily (MFS) profile domain-containing protein n=1 Tax=Streptacidiphilus monticola TaxID=2161674 RepID=A0ABW1GCN6_9ACTN